MFQYTYCLLVFFTFSLVSLSSFNLWQALEPVPVCSSIPRGQEGSLLQARQAGVDSRLFGSLFAPRSLPTTSLRLEFKHPGQKGQDVQMTARVLLPGNSLHPGDTNSPTKPEKQSDPVFHGRGFPRMWLLDAVLGLHLLCLCDHEGSW